MMREDQNSAPLQAVDMMGSYAEAVATRDLIARELFLGTDDMSESDSD